MDLTLNQIYLTNFGFSRHLPSYSFSLVLESSMLAMDSVNRKDCIFREWRINFIVEVHYKPNSFEFLFELKDFLDDFPMVMENRECYRN